MSPLKLAPYSKTTLCWVEDVCFQMISYDAGWIINLYGERIGYTVKRKKGWVIEGYPSDWQKQTLVKAQELLDAHFNAECK